jgi:hypothetical protein
MLTAADDVDAAFASVWMPYPGTPFFTRAMYGLQSVSVRSRAARETLLVASTCCVFSVAWEFRFFLLCLTC